MILDGYLELEIFTTAFQSLFIVSKIFMYLQKQFICIDNFGWPYALFNILRLLKFCFTLNLILKSG